AITIRHETDEKQGIFVAIKDGTQAGLMTYTWIGSKKFIIDHTEVHPNFEGTGVGKKMVYAAVNYARENELKIIPLCSFAKALFDKDSGIRDVL
ncbi:MAG TPA: GNAT family N-acetyltransferase, partial [Methanosarcina sp.]|nr:GNAT family N-acetyltransferase [Methanosarcina sp.]